MTTIRVRRHACLLAPCRYRWAGGENRFPPARKREGLRARAASLVVPYVGSERVACEGHAPCEGCGGGGAGPWR